MPYLFFDANSLMYARCKLQQDQALAKPVGPSLQRSGSLLIHAALQSLEVLTVQLQ